MKCDNSKINISLASARVNSGMNQKEMADFLGVDISVLIKWEEGKTEPNVNQLRKISEVSKIPIDFIYVQRKS